MKSFSSVAALAAVASVLSLLVSIICLYAVRDIKSSQQKNGVAVQAGTASSHGAVVAYVSGAGRNVANSGTEPATFSADLGSR